METLFRFEVYGDSCLGNRKFQGTYIAHDMIVAIKRLKCDGYFVKKIEEKEMVHDMAEGEENIELI